jgi:hypothetical protein
VAAQPASGANTWQHSIVGPSLNFILIAYPAETPAVLQIGTGEKQVWRVCNASADSLLDLQVVYDGVPQPLQIVGIDGVPASSQDGKRRGQLVGQQI